MECGEVKAAVILKLQPMLAWKLALKRMDHILEPGGCHGSLKWGRGRVRFTFQKDYPCCAGHTRMGKVRSGRKQRNDCESGLGGWTGEY